MNYLAIISDVQMRVCQKTGREGGGGGGGGGMRKEGEDDFRGSFLVLRMHSRLRSRSAMLVDCRDFRKARSACSDVSSNGHTVTARLPVSEKNRQVHDQPSSCPCLA